MTCSFVLAAFLGCTAALVSGAALDWNDCYCPIQVNNGACYYTLVDAITAAAAGDTINLFDNVVVYEEIPFDKSLNFVGHGTPGPRMDASMNMEEGAMLRVTGMVQTILLKNINFGRLGDGLASAFRSIEPGNGLFPNLPPSSASLHLTIDSCTFKNFSTLARGGAAMFLSQTGYLDISNTEFSDNTNQRYKPKRWEGGGALWIQSIYGHSVMRNTTFLRNRSLWYHGQGGGFMINWLGTDFLMDHVIMKYNHAPGGGAVFLGTINKHTTTTVTNSLFYKNNATEFGWGSRGGAMWTQYIEGNFVVKDNVFFIGNHVDHDRGAVFANNKVLTHGRVSLNASFHNNYCLRGAFLFDSLSTWIDKGATHMVPAFRGEAEVIIEAGTVLENNIVHNNQDPNLMIRLDRSAQRGIIMVQRDAYTGETLTITNNPDNAPNVPHEKDSNKALN